jgi:hypothetical protein
MLPAHRRISRALGLLAIALGAFCGCSNPFSADATYYIVMRSDRQEAFITELTAISKAHGLVPYTSRVTSDRGYTMHVLEATGHFMRLWTQNGTLSPGECGSDKKAPSVDSNEFILAVTPQYNLPIRGKARVLASGLASGLTLKGYIVRSVRPDCANAEMTPNNRFERSRAAASVSQGEGR